MNSIAHRGTELLQPYISIIPPQSHIMFVFGEPDCRIHIHKQIHQCGRSEDEVLETLARNYVHMVKHICSLTNCTGIIRYVLPPIDKAVWNNPLYTPHGTIMERVNYTQKLNMLLSSLCAHNELYFIDNIHRAHVIIENGSLNHYYADDETHYNTNALHIINDELTHFYTRPLNPFTRREERPAMQPVP
jgi:hypothetical protein